MDYLVTPSSILFQFAFFIGWSSLLYLTVKLVTKLMPSLVSWSRFWQIWLLIALVPLIPVSLYQADILIPDVLKMAYDSTQDNVLSVSTSMVTQATNTKEFAILSWLILLTMLGGSCISLVGFMSGVAKVRALLKQAEINSDLHGFNPQQKAFIRANNIRVFTASQNISPMVFGFLNVTMLLPSNVFLMPEQQRLLLIEHELMHVKRQDPKAVIVFRLLACLFWFNPFIRYVEQRFLQSMELNCDLAVISTFPKDRLHYAHALITSLKLSKSTVETGLISYFSGPQFNKRDFENRITQAMTNQPRNTYGLSHWLLLTSMSIPMSFFSIAAKPFLPLELLSNNQVKGINPLLHGRISSGYSDISAFRGNKPHRAIDITAPVGTEIVASFSGKVLIADGDTLHRNYGNVVLIEHDGQMQSLYAHLDSYEVEAGQYILAGQTIGTVGATGRTTGPHLHFELLKDGKHTDPTHYLSLADE